MVSSAPGSTFVLDSSNSWYYKTFEIPTRITHTSNVYRVVGAEYSNYNAFGNTQIKPWSQDALAVWYHYSKASALSGTIEFVAFVLGACL